MGGFELLEHTADVGVLAWGDTLAEALASLAKGLFSVITDVGRIEPKESISITVVSADTTSLPVDWLNELLYQFAVEQFVPRGSEVKVNDRGMTLTARCTGERFDPGRHQMFTDVKAATYHNLEVSHDGQWRIKVILDV